MWYWLIGGSICFALLAIIIGAIKENGGSGDGPVWPYF